MLSGFKFCKREYNLTQKLLRSVLKPKVPNSSHFSRYQRCLKNENRDVKAYLCTVHRLHENLTATTHISSSFNIKMLAFLSAKLTLANHIMAVDDHEHKSSNPIL